VDQPFVWLVHGSSGSRQESRRPLKSDGLRYALSSNVAPQRITMQDASSILTHRQHGALKSATHLTECSPASVSLDKSGSAGCAGIFRWPRLGLFRTVVTAHGDFAAANLYL